MYPIYKQHSKELKRLCDELNEATKKDKYVLFGQRILGHDLYLLLMEIKEYLPRVIKQLQEDEEEWESACSDPDSDYFIHDVNSRYEYRK